MLSLSQRQTLQQRLSPQQVQYLKMLQLPVIALEQRIKQEIEINPLLEELSEIVQEQQDNEFEPEPAVSLTERRTTESDDRSGSDGDSMHGGEPQETPASREFDWDDYVSGDYEGYKAPSFTGPDNEEQDEFPQRAEESLADQLLGQLRMQLLSEDELALAEEIIGNIDDHGYLRRDLREIVDDLNKFISNTLRVAQQKKEEQSLLGDGRFDAYADVVADAPFGRDRLVAQLLNDQEDELGEKKRGEDDLDDIPADPFSVSFDDDDMGGTIGGRSNGSYSNGHGNGGYNGGSHGGQLSHAGSNGAATEVATAASPAAMSLEEMSRLSIEDLARLLEQGTAALAPSAPADDVSFSDAETNGTMEGAADFEAIFSLEEAERVLHRIQRLEPPGIGARDLRECLAVQLELDADHSPAHQLAHRIIQESYIEFTMKHFEKICHRLNCTTEDLKEAIDVIKLLNPKPGEGASSIVEDNYLTPDFVIERDDDDFLIIPNDRHIPTLRINRAYQEMMRRGSGKRKEVDRDTRKFIRDKFEAAKWFIASIQQRRQTMMKVMRAIVDLQMDFFLQGPNFIRPMIYKDVAERIGMDISTVCRVVNGKYAQTDYGTFELRYFFSEKLETTSGEEVSTKIVKSRIEELIAAEDKNRPLSDDAISREMEVVGFYVARRTVAKYREQMNIPVARLRRAL